MRQVIIRCAATFVLIVVIACNQQTQGPTTWIDRPLDGDQVAMEPLTIQAHASDSDGVGRFDFLIGDTPLVSVSGSGSRFAQADAGWIPSEPGIYVVHVRATDTNGNIGADATAQITVGESAVTAPMPTQEPGLTPTPTFAISSEVRISFTADRNNVQPGECAILQWDVQGSVEVVQLDGQQVNRVGQAQVCPQQTTTYSLRAGTAASENSKHSELTISVESSIQPPTCSSPPAIAFFAADPNTISAGQSTTLSWGAITNATSAMIDQGVGGPALSGGTFGPLSPTTTTTFTLTATGCGGTTMVQVTVVVNPAQPSSAQPAVCPGPPVIASFGANPSTITAGQSSTLSWGAVTNATSAVIDPDVGGVGTPGSTTVNPGMTRTYTLTATGCGGSTKKQVTITVNPAPLPPPPPEDTFPPVVSNVGANPTSLVKDGIGCPRSSRTTTVSATVVDAGGVNRVIARVLGTGIEVTMNPSGGNSYQATIGPFNVTGTLSIVVIAWDNAGHSGQGGPVSIQVSQCIQ